MVKAYYPTNLQEALQIREDEKVVPYAGGTDYMVRKNPNDLLMFINGLQELKAISEDKYNIYIGSGCTYADLLKNHSIPHVLKKAIAEVAAPGIRNLGTIGGNICNASPAGDTLPALYALEAILKVSSLKDKRFVKIENFIYGPKQTSLQSNELLEQIIIPKKSFNALYYKKIGGRNAQAISKMSFVGLMNIEDEIIKDIRIALGAVGPRVVRSRFIESMVIGKRKEEVIENIDDILNEYSVLITPIDDQRSTAKYRRKVSLNLIEDFFNTALL